MLRFLGDAWGLGCFPGARNLQWRGVPGSFFYLRCCYAFTFGRSGVVFPVAFCLTARVLETGRGGEEGHDGLTPTLCRTRAKEL